jgi:integrase
LFTPHPTKLGKVKTESFKSETQAIDRRDTLNHIHETSKKTLKTEKCTVNDALTFWVEKKASTLVSSVKEVPRAKYIGAVIGNIRLSDLDEAHYEKLFLHIKHDDTRSISTDRGIDAYFITLRTALNFSKKKRKLLTFPAFDDFIRGKYEPRDRIATEAELKELLKACFVVKGGKDRKHLAIIIEWLHETACRSGELKTIRVKDIDLEAGIVKIRQSKRKRERKRSIGIAVFHHAFKKLF